MYSEQVQIEEFGLKANIEFKIQSINFGGDRTEGDIGGYPIPQYRKKNWQIPKYLVENRRNTDTAMMCNNLACLFIASMYAPAINLRHCEKT